MPYIRPGGGPGRQPAAIFFYLQNFGAAGVDIFFVISGFIITIVAYPHAQRRQGRPFFVKRLLRVVPLYWLVSVLAAILFYRRNGSMVETTAIAKTFLFYPFVGNAPEVGPVLFQGWTLSFELLFYTVTALAIRLGSKKYMPAVILFFLCSVLLNYALGNLHPLLVFLGNGIMLEFLLGICCGWLFLSGASFTVLQSNAIMVAGIAGLLLTLLLGYGGISEYGTIVFGTLSLHRSALWGIPAGLLVAGVAMREKHRPLRVSLFWIGIGNASFSIYLVHILILRSLYVRWTKWGIQGKLQPDLQVVVIMGIVVALGYLFYLLVEKPLLRRLKALTAGGANPGPLLKTGE